MKKCDELICSYSENGKSVCCEYFEECKGLDDLFEGIGNTEVTIPSNFKGEISEESKKESEFEDTLNAQY